MSRNKIQFGRPKKAKPKSDLISINVNNLSIDGRGVAKIDGKTTFIEGAIPGEQLSVKINTRHKTYDEASIHSIETPSIHRVAPPCQHFEQCGGCQLQHIETSAQLDFKQQAVLDMLKRNAKVTPAEIIAPLKSTGLHYRRSARIGVNRLSQSQSAIVGFRRKNSSKLLQVTDCLVLPQQLNGLFDQLRETLDQIENAKAITHIEYLQGDNTGALTFRCMAALTGNSKALLEEMLRPFNLQGYLRYDHSLEPLTSNQPSLNFLVEQQVLSFEPGDFLQANAAINQQMVVRAKQWLALNETDIVLDLFAGLGNFSIPVACEVKQLTGVEGSDKMVQRAAANAIANQLDNCQFFKADLSQDIQHHSWSKQTYNKIIIDPPRSGATSLIKQLLQSKDKGETLRPTHILYIACDSSSLVRDTAQLDVLGYKMDKFSVMDMFPNTAHIESMALFVRAEKKTKKRPTKRLFGL